MKIIIKKQTKNKLNKTKPIIVIPKKNVKKANKRNKIRRQIRAILRNNNFDKNVFIKYDDNNENPNFEILQSTMLYIANKS